MSNFTSTIQGDYPLNTLQTLRDLWGQMIIAIGEDARLITNEDYSAAPESLQFCSIESPSFNALLIATAKSTDSDSLYSIEITFTPAEINLFFQPRMVDLPTAKLISTDFIANDPTLQGHFTNLLLAAISENCLRDREAALQQQIQQAHLLNQISTQINRNLDLDIILQTAIDLVRKYLVVDRLVIYQFEFVSVAGKISPKSFDDRTGNGKITHESIDSLDISSVLAVFEGWECFADRQVWNQYQGGMTKTIEFVDRAYAKYPDLLALMQRYQIQSQSIVPIIVKGQLWGLLITHQCQYPRNWQVEEIEFLQQVAEQLAFGIDRSELYAASQWHTQYLEQRVNERTRELRDAVIVTQTANQSKTEFLALLSHELRTPLTSILGLSATLLRLPFDNLTERQQKYIQTIHNSGEHLSELIDDILDFYKLEVGKTFLKISEFSLSKLVKQVVELVRVKADLGKIDLQVQIINNGNDVTHISGRDPRFRGDTKRIRQVLLNILINAIKFTPEHGTVVVRAWVEDSYAIFEVEDSGIGIEAEQIPRLFKKFHQLNPNYDRDYAGMGLGLAITQQLVELHGGWIDVDSIFGSGSTFTIRVAEQPLQAPERNDWDELDRKLVFQDPELNPVPKRIILIEPDENLANFMCDILTAARYQVTWLLSAESSFRQIAMFQPDLLIVDVSDSDQMVDRLIYNIRKSIVLANLKILAVATKEDILTPIIKQYIDEYLWKQVNPEQLLRKITKLLSQPINS